MSRPSVVISGLGVVSPAGVGKEVFWSNVLLGKNNFKKISCFDTSLYPNHIGSEVNDFIPSQLLSSSEVKVYGRATQFALTAAHEAICDSKILDDKQACDSARIGVVIGTTFGEAQIVEKATKNVCSSKNIRRNLVHYSPNILSVTISKKFGFKGPTFVVPTACAAGNYAVAFGAFLIRQGLADVMIVGGSDPLSHVSFSGFSRLGVMSDSICQPFDANRKGMIVGEGGGILVLERENLRAEKKRSVYAKILSCGFSCDASHMTTPDVSGVKSMMINALNDAGLVEQDIDYVCAHGTGTSMNDKTESAAIKDVFYSKGHEVPVSSIKSVIGHTMGAASAIETIACCLALRDQVLPPTSNFESKDPDCDIDCVPNTARNQRLNIVMNNALAFGGNNASLVLTRE